jgi:hypothetical protein
VAGRSYVQLVPTPYYGGHVGRFSVVQGRERAPGEILTASGVTDDETASALDAFATQRGANGFGSTDKKRPLEP